MDGVFGGPLGGQTLVVESNGYNDRTWLDGAGHPHTEAMRTTERYRRIDFGHMELVLTISDPSLYTKPLNMKINFTLVPDTEMIEYVCAENEKDRAHMISKARDLDRRDLPVETLAQFTGTYRAGPQVLKVHMEGKNLKLDFSGFLLDLIPVGGNSFSSPLVGHVAFQRDGQGKVTHLTLELVGGDLRAERAP